MLLNAYCTHRAPPPLAFRHRLNSRRDRSDPELASHLRPRQVPGRLRQVPDADLARPAALRRERHDEVGAAGLDPRRADDQILVEMLQRSIASTIPQPTKSEAQKFMEGKPARKVIVVPGRLVNIVA